MQTLLPSYLEQTMAAFAKEQEKMRSDMSALFTQNPIDMFKSGQAAKLVEAQVRRNMEMFQSTMRLMSPFGATLKPDAAAEKPAQSKAETERGELDQLRDQISAMQRKLDSL
jgi:polyhydroxyalkanoate synthesis regulator protein